MPRAGARVEDLAFDRAECDQLLHHRLRSADVPRCGGRQAVCDPIVAVHLFETGRIVGIELRCHVSPSGAEFRAANSPAARRERVAR